MVNCQTVIDACGSQARAHYARAIPCLWPVALLSRGNWSLVGQKASGGRWL